LGFENIQRLQHGIIGYEQWANKHKEIVGSGGGVWEGENFLFDKRRLLK
jgi:predicted sulfurtransferase